MSDITFDNEPAPVESSASDFFSSGAASCRFTKIGDAHQGEIIAAEESQQRDIQTKALAVWPDGNPKMMLVITLQTSERDDEIDDDDGQRRLYVNKPSGMFAAIRAAVGKEKFLIGGKLAVKYTGNGKPKNPGFSPPKEYVAKYVPPTSSKTTSNDDFQKLEQATNGDYWTFEEAVEKAGAEGIKREDFIAGMKTQGKRGAWVPDKDTTTAKLVIEKLGVPF